MIQCRVDPRSGCRIEPTYLNGIMPLPYLKPIGKGDIQQLSKVSHFGLKKEDNHGYFLVVLKLDLHVTVVFIIL